MQISNVIENARYLRLYYLLDNAIRNKGNLTLLRLEYCDKFSCVLKLIFKRINKTWDKDEKIIPDKGGILRDMKKNTHQQNTHRQMNCVIL